MAEIHIEKKDKGGMGWLWALMAILAVVLIGWWLWPEAENEIAEVTPAPMVAAPVATDTAVTTANATVGTVMANPQQWVGRQFSGTVQVAEVPTDRGFWIEQDGQRMFALIIDGPAEKPVDINAGQRIQIHHGTLRDAAYIPQIKGDDLTSSTETVVRDQPIYLVVDEANLTILDRAA